MAISNKRSAGRDNGMASAAANAHLFVADNKRRDVAAAVARGLGSM